MNALMENEFIDAELTYIVDDGKPSIRYVDWPEEKHNERLASYEPRQTRIFNGRLLANPAKLDTFGFELLKRKSAVSNFYNEAEVKELYYSETAEIIRQKSGATSVHVFDHTVRTPDTSTHKEGWVRSPVRYVHNDYTERSAAQRVNDFFPDKASDLLKKRFAIIQTWRSIGDRVESEPLALCDGKTIPETGFIRNERRYRDRTAETYHISFNPAHEWYYFPHMTNEELLIFKVFDTSEEVDVRFTAHTAFSDPNTSPDAPARQSIEMRALAFF